MNCWICDRPAHGVCQFCGRAVCRDDARTMPHIVALYRDKQERHKTIITANALFCGKCEPREEPVELTGLD